MTGAKRKRSVIYISSSDEEEEEEEKDDDDEYEAEEIDDDEEIEVEEHDVDEIDDEEESEVEEYDVDEIDDEEESEVDENDDDEDEGISGVAIDCSEDEEKKSINVVDDDDEAFCKHVISLLQEGKDLKALSLKECKAYLRKHGIRLAGNKAVCIHRIEEHWRINKGNADTLYPRSSFVINCTGDVCKGDVVLFRQKVYKKFDKVTRNGNVVGMRTVAGRVVKESYGSARQQHTFTVEVLWSKGTKKLSPLFPLLVKGRNLYKRKTFRQRWNNEAERTQVLAEKHRRGAAARAAREMKRSKNNQSAKRHQNEGRKYQKCSHHRRPSELSKGKHSSGNKKNTSIHRREINNHHCKASSSRQPNLKGNVRCDVGYNPDWMHPNRGHLNMEMDPTLNSHGYTGIGTLPWQIDFHNQNLPSQFTGHPFSSSSTMVSPLLLRPASQHQEFFSRNDIHRHQPNPVNRRNLNYVPESCDGQFSRAREQCEQSRGGYQRFHARTARFGR